MKTKTLIPILCLCVFLLSFSNKKETTQTNDDNSNLVKSLVQTTDYLKLQINSPMKLAEYTANKNDKSSLIKSASKDVIFIPNKGQIIDTEGMLRPDILYKAELNGVDLYLTNKGMSFVFYKYEDKPKNLAAGDKEIDRMHDPFKDDPIRDRKVEMYRMDLDILGMNKNVKTLNEEQTEAYFNYYYSHCPDGITNVNGYRKVIFKNIYNNIDLVYNINENRLKYDFIVKPGGKVSDIKLKYKNEDNVYITTEGKIRAINPFGELVTDVLYTYQFDGIVVKSNYQKDTDGTISINTKEYDRTKDLIIDPYIGATYYGGSGWDEGRSITSDGNNNILITGSSTSLNFPVLNPGGGAYFKGTNNGNNDVFIIKFNSSSLRQWATYYGGFAGDNGWSIAADGNNNIVVTGYTASTDLPLHNPGGGAYFQSTGGDYDLFILKFNESGVRLWATYYGGSNIDYGWSIATDGNNNIVVTGITASTDLPLHNPGGGAYFQDTGTGHDVFILKFNSSGVRQWATYYGGNSGGVGYSITTDGNNNILLTGKAVANFPLQNPGGGAYYQATYRGNGDAFILKFNSNGVRQWATYYGGYSPDIGYSITTDGNDNILLTGRGGGTEFSLLDPGGGAFFQTYGHTFILKFSSNGVRLWATLYGGFNQIESGYSITTDVNNNILLTGYTKSTSFPVYNPGGGAYFQNNYVGGSDWGDVFILKFNSSAIRQWATYYGGSGDDLGCSITTDGNSNIFVTGTTKSSNFPVFDPGGGAYFQGTGGGLAGDWDAFILGFRPTGAIRIKVISTNIPVNYKLYQNYPNPFNPKTNIGFDIPKSSFVKIAIYDLLGKNVITLVNEKLTLGSYEVIWDASSYLSGVYFYKLITDDFVDVKKMVLLK